jgi:hypothetical protein
MMTSLPEHEAERQAEGAHPRARIRTRSGVLYTVLILLTLLYVLILGPQHLGALPYRLPEALAVALVGTVRLGIGLWSIRGRARTSRYRLGTLLCIWLMHLCFAVFLVLWFRLAGLIPFILGVLCIPAALVCAEYDRTHRVRGDSPVLMRKEEGNR